MSLIIIAMFRIVTLIIVFLLTAPFCYGFEPLFYSHFPENNPQFIEVSRISNQADRTIFCGRNLDQIDIGIGVELGGGLSDIVYFTRAQIHHFLKHEQHKDLLVVWFEKGIMWTGPEKVQESLRN